MKRPAAMSAATSLTDNSLDLEKSMPSNRDYLRDKTKSNETMKGLEMNNS